MKRWFRKGGLTAALLVSSAPSSPHVPPSDGPWPSSTGTVLSSSATPCARSLVVSRRGYASTTHANDGAHGTAPLADATPTASSLFDQLRKDVRCLGISPRPPRTGAATCADWERLLQLLALVEEGEGGHIAPATASAPDVVTNPDSAAEAHAFDEAQLTTAEGARLLEHLLHRALRELARAEAGTHSRLWLSRAEAVYEARRRLNPHNVRAERLPSPERENEAPFASKGLYYSYSHALLVDVERQLLLLTQTCGAAASPPEGRDDRGTHEAITSALLPTVDRALKVLLVDAPADHHPSAARPSNMLLALVALHHCGVLCMCARLTDTSHDGFPDQAMMPFLLSAFAAWKRSHTPHVTPATQDAWSDFKMFLESIAESCLSLVVQRSSQAAPVQEALWLWQHLLIVVSDSSARAAKSAGVCVPRCEVDVMRVLEAAQQRVRIGSTLAQRLHAVASENSPAPVCAAASAPSARLLWTSLSAVPQLALRRVCVSPERQRAVYVRKDAPASTPSVYTLQPVTEDASANVAGSMLRLEREWLVPFITASTTMAPQESKASSLSVLLDYLERSASACSAFLAPWPVRLDFSLRSPQDQWQLDLLDGTTLPDHIGSPQEYPVGGGGGHGTGAPGVVSVQLHTSVCALLVQERLCRAATQLHSDSGSSAHALIAELSRLFLLIDSVKQQQRARGGGRGGRTSRASRAGTIRLEQVYAVEQALWFNLLTAIHNGDGALTPIDTSSAVHADTNGAESSAVLQRLVFPLYGHRQWRAPTVDLFVAVLDQWGLKEQMRDVFRVIFQREAQLREAVLEAVRHDDDAGEREEERSTAEEARHSEASEQGGKKRASTAPALSLASCQLVLSACCGDAGERAHRLSSEGRGGASEAPGVHPFMAMQVVEYMMVALHWWRFHQARTQSSTDVGSLLIQGRTLEAWHSWITQEARPRVHEAFARSGEDMPESW